MSTLFDQARAVAVEWAEYFHVSAVVICGAPRRKYLLRVGGSPDTTSGETYVTVWEARQILALAQEQDREIEEMYAAVHEGVATDAD